MQAAGEAPRAIAAVGAMAGAIPAAGAMMMVDAARQRHGHCGDETRAAAAAGHAGAAAAAGHAKEAGATAREEASGEGAAGEGAEVGACGLIVKTRRARRCLSASASTKLCKRSASRGWRSRCKSFLILLHMCPRITIYVLLYMCPHTTIYVSAGSRVSQR